MGGFNCLAGECMGNLYVEVQACAEVFYTPPGQGTQVIPVNLIEVNGEKLCSPLYQKKTIFFEPADQFPNGAIQLHVEVYGVMPVGNEPGGFIKSWFPEQPLMKVQSSNSAPPSGGDQLVAVCAVGMNADKLILSDTKKTYKVNLGCW